MVQCKQISFNDLSSFIASLPGTFKASAVNALPIWQESRLANLPLVYLIANPDDTDNAFIHC